MPGQRDSKDKYGRSPVIRELSVRSTGAESTAVNALMWVAPEPAWGREGALGKCDPGVFS